MKKFFTQATDNHFLVSELNKVSIPALNPRTETLRFLCQFARVYHFEPKLAQGLCSYILN